MTVWMMVLSGARFVDIALIVDGFPRLSETFILNQIAGLLDRGHNVFIAASQLHGDQEMHPEFMQYNLLERAVPFAVNDSGMLRLGRALKLAGNCLRIDPIKTVGAFNVLRYGRNAANLRLIHWLAPFIDRRFDILHCHFATNGIIGVSLKSLGIPGKVVTTFHGYDVSRIPHLYGADMFRDLFTDGDLFTANTSFTASNARNLGCPGEKIIVLPMSIDLRRYTCTERRPGDDGKIRFVTVARLVEKKGLQYAIKAVGKLLKSYPAIQYRIAGDGPLRGELEGLVNDLGLADNVFFMGPMRQDGVRNLYAESHICLVPSVTDRQGDQEGQGVVLQEAQASGLPVIATRHNGFPEGLLDGESGFLVPEKDPEALAERMAYLIDHTDIWPSMGRAGRTFVEQKYDQERITGRLEQIYTAVLNNDSVLLNELRSGM